MIDIISIKQAVKNGELFFENTDKGIFCKDLNSGECVLVSELKEISEDKKSYWLIGNECGGKILYLQYVDVFNERFRFGNIVTAMRFSSPIEAKIFMDDLNYMGNYKIIKKDKIKVVCKDNK